MKSFFEYLYKNDLSPRKMEDTISHWSLSQMTNFILNSHEHIKFAETQTNPSLFDFSCSSSLSGQPIECASYNCRLSKAKHLANFAALYSNRVVIINPLPSFPPLEYNPTFHKSLIDTLKILYFFRPLLEEGIILLTPKEFAMCKECYNDLITLKKHIRNTAKELIRPILNEIDINIEDIGKYSLVNYSGPEKIFSHTSVCEIIYDDVESVKKKRKTTHVINHLQPILSDLLFQNISAKRNYANFLTDNDFYIELAQAIKNPDVTHYNKSFMEGFSHNLPFVSEVDLKKLLKLRETEGESFLVYRDALAKAIKEGLTSDSKHINNIFNDIVLPEINKIELVFKNSRKILVNSIKKDFVISSGFIGIGLFSGILTPHLNEMLLALGGYNFVTSVADKVNKLFKDPDEIKNCNYYFLWKTRKLN